MNKISNLADTRQAGHWQIPMSREELFPFTERAPNNVINRYQKKNGSLLYADKCVLRRIRDHPTTLLPIDIDPTTFSIRRWRIPGG